jgi:hypothetical protein
VAKRRKRAEVSQYFDEARNIIEKMRQYNCINHGLQARGPSEGVRSVGDALLHEYLESGEILTRVLRLPGGPQALLLEYYNGSPPYSHHHPQLNVMLKNVGDEVVEVLEEVINRPKINLQTGCETDAMDADRIYLEIEPGESVMLPANRAVAALYEYCRPAWDPQLQHNWPHSRDVLREDGYEFVSGGKRYETKKRKKAS